MISKNVQKACYFCLFKD